MAQAPEDRPSDKPWPPIVYAAALAACWLIESLISLPRLPESLILRWIGAVVVIAGVGLALTAFMELRSEGTTFNPTGSANALANEGIYAYSRNPMYLAALIAFTGLGLALRSTALLLAVPAMAVALTKLAIEPEEAYLERRFGERYRRYKARVRRWI
jgi:protein-S-isoprenylcysteine O-methyltransferase Ste14